jgi:NADPH2:quinone reductase
MHAIRQYEFGPPSTLRYEKVLDPRPGPGQVRVAVEAAGVHVVDTTIRRGVEGGPFPLPALPMTPGREVAGVVDEIGPDVDPGWLGRRVVAHLGQASGGYAELALASATRVHAVPDGLSAAGAVAMIGTGRTAAGLLDVAGLTAADVVVVTAAAGGLGSLFVQAARTTGATVVGLAGGPDKVERVRALGADVAVDYRQPGWPDQVRDALAGRRPTVVLDGVGGTAGRDVFELLGPGGRLVRFGWSSGAPAEITSEEFDTRGVTDVAVTGRQFIQRLPELEAAALGRAGRGVWRPLVQEFPLGAAAGAHHAIETRATTGKVVLVP